MVAGYDILFAYFIVEVKSKRVDFLSAGFKNQILFTNRFILVVFSSLHNLLWPDLGTEIFS